MTSSQDESPRRLGRATTRKAAEVVKIIPAILKAIRQFTDPAFRGVFVRSVLLSIVVFAALTAFVWWALQSWGVLDGLLGWLFGFFSWTLFAVVTWVLFPAIVTLFVSLFLDEIADAVEGHHYPDDPRGTALGYWEAFVIGLRFTSLLVLLNLCALFLYVLFFWMPLINVFIFYGLNGYLLSREYFDLVALRHGDEGQAARLRRKNAGKLFLTGVVFAFLLTIPVVNLMAPIIGVAAMVHIFKGLARPA